MLLLGISATVSAQHSVEISEFMAMNVFTLDDEDGNSEDWLELRNTSETESVDLSGWHLTDNAGDLRKWMIPEGVSLAPNDFLLIFASGKDRVDPRRRLHTNFKLSSAGEYLAIALPDGETVVDAFAPAYPGQFQDVSFGRPAGGGEPTYLAEPTPDSENAGPVSLGPVVTNTSHYPLMPPAVRDLVVTATVVLLDAPVDTMTLTYRINYDPEQDPIPMRDDGVAPDEAAGDGQYTALIPNAAYAAGDMVRWRVNATDTLGNPSQYPLYPEPGSSPQYDGTVVYDPDVESNLPVFYWFLRPGTQGAAGTRSGTRASVFFGEEFYDNVFVRVRGGSTTSLAKKSYKFDFNPKHHFRFDARFGRASEINMNTTYTDKSYIRQGLSYEVYHLAGAPASESFNVRIQQNGQFFSVAAFIEQPDDDLLLREGLGEEGALYKMYNNFSSGTSGVEKKNRQYENNADLAAFVSGVNGKSGEALKRYVFDHVDIPRMVCYLAGNSLTQNADSMKKNYYLYCDSDGSGEWFPLPWDLDLTFGRHYMTRDSILDDVLWADEDWVMGGSARNVPISPSHPFMGMQELPGNRSWNRLLDKLFNMPEFRAMFQRRMRSVLEEVYGHPNGPEDEKFLDLRIEELAVLLGDDAVLDLAKWGNFGQRQTLAQAITFLREDFLAVHRWHLFATHSALTVDEYPQPRAFSAEFPESQARRPGVAFGDLEVSPATGNQDEEYIQLVNPTNEDVDISGWRMAGAVTHTFLPGTVILSGSAIYVSPDVRTFRSRGASPKGDEGLFVQGGYNGHLSNWGETVCLYMPDDDGNAIACATYEGNPSLSQQFLRITELHYHPLAPSPEELAADFDDQDDFEFIELKNMSDSETLDLTGIRFTEGVEFDFTGADVTTLGPGGIVLIVNNRPAFEFRYGSGLPVAGQYMPMQLDNDGEEVKLEDPLNNTILAFWYDDDDDLGWPDIADGNGMSLEIVDSDGDYDLAANWRASTVVHGTPGTHGEGGPVQFIRGDVDESGKHDLADAIRILGYLFTDKDIGCLDAADVNDDGGVNLADPIALLAYLFTDGEDPLPPFPDCGADPTEDPMVCTEETQCGE